MKARFFLYKVILFLNHKNQKSWQTNQKARAAEKGKVILAKVKVVATAVVKAERNKTLPAAVLLPRTLNLEKKVNLLAVIMEIQEEAVHASSCDRNYLYKSLSL